MGAIEDLAAQVARLRAVEDLRQLAYRYAVAVDSRDIDLLVSLFVDDVGVGRSERGRAALARFMDASLRQIGVSVLSVSNHLVDLHDDSHASGVVYCRAEIQVDDRWVVQAIQYRDTYERREGTWLFVRRRHLLWYGAELGQSPLGLAPANWPEHHTGRGELPELWESWGRFWAAPPDG